jgi:hypothetical protein
VYRPTLAKWMPQAALAAPAEPLPRFDGLLALAIPALEAAAVPAVPDLLAYAELRYRGTEQALEAAELLLPRVLRDAAA